MVWFCFSCCGGRKRGNLMIDGALEPATEQDGRRDKQTEREKRKRSKKRSNQRTGIMILVEIRLFFNFFKFVFFSSTSCLFCTQNILKANSTLAAKITTFTIVFSLTIQAAKGHYCFMAQLKSVWFRGGVFGCSVVDSWTDCLP